MGDSIVSYRNCSSFGVPVLKRFTCQLGISSDVSSLSPKIAIVVYRKLSLTCQCSVQLAIILVHSARRQPGRGEFHHPSWFNYSSLYILDFYTTGLEGIIGAGCIVHRITLENALYYSSSVGRDVFVSSFISLAHTTDYAGKYYTTNHHASDYNHVLGPVVR